jgi:uncharacterized protein with HEPN domain
LKRIAPLPSERPARRVEDIIENGQKILAYTSGMNFDSFERDEMVYDAVERCLERICEAATKLGSYAPELMPDQPWDEIRGLGNKLRHEYDRITRARVWDIVQTGVRPLIAACDDALRNLSQPADNQPL